MKITKIVFNNIGPYIGENVFDLTSSHDKNIVLIGGINGAGKTTFFKSVKTGIYGCRVWGFDVPNTKYYKIIDSLISDKIKYSKNENAYIEITFLIEDGKENHKYCIKREWEKKKTSISENLEIKKNEILITKEEKDNFELYLMSLIPPNTLSMYFFDGESIGEFFLGDEGTKNFRSAFLALYGLDTISLMTKNFNRNRKKKEKINIEEYNKISDEYQLVEEQASDVLLEIDELKNLVDTIDKRIKKAEQDYKKNGGITIEEWKTINEELNNKEIERKEIHHQIKEFTNNVLPFLMMKNEIELLKAAMDSEKAAIYNEAIKEKLCEENFAKSFKEFLLRKNCNIEVKEIINFICSDENNKLNDSTLFDFSISDRQEIQRKINQVLQFDKTDIQNKFAYINESKDEAKILREKLNNNSLKNYEIFLEEKNQLQDEYYKKNEQYEEKKLEYIKIKGGLDEKEKKLINIRKNLERELKKASVIDISNRAAIAFSLLEEKLIILESKKLEKSFLENFKKIINKDAFIDGIVIDEKVNVFPYKNIEISNAEYDRYLEENKGFVEIFNKKHETMNFSKKDVVENIMVPVPIKVDKLSKGEKQIYILALYLSLLNTSNADVPFFIDTPFARVDSIHREALLKNFFMGIDKQIFILSTDEEIVGNYEEMIKDKISNRFLLKVESYGKTNIIKDKYF